MKDKLLIERLKDYSSHGRRAFHMPGHMRRKELYPYLSDLDCSLDITEIQGFDNLHHPEDILLESMKKLSSIYGSKRSFFMVNGSTGGLLAAISAATSRGDKILVARNCHKAVYNGMMLCGLSPVFLMPEYDSSFGIYGSISPQSVEKALEENPDIKLVVITSPTYEGVVSDISSICRVSHKRSIPVLVDEAHGPHLGFLDPKVPGAVSCGADIVIQSFHKTLPSLTQTAVAHINGSLVSEEELAYKLSVFETSSPSYILMASLDGCTDYLYNSQEDFREWYHSLESLDTLAKELRYLRILCYGRDKLSSHSFYSFDRSKLVISCKNTSISGPSLMDTLRQDYGIECEMHSRDYVVAMTGAGTSREDLLYLISSLKEIDHKLTENKNKQDAALILKAPSFKLDMDTARQSSREYIPIEDAEDRISSGFLWAYPPGIPLVIPGEAFNKEIIESLLSLACSGINLEGDSGDYKGTVAVIKQ